MIVLVNGIPLFSKRLVEDLKSMDTANKYIFLDTYNSYWQQLLFIGILPFSSLVISMNGVTDNSGSLNWVVRLKKKLILQWMGTDSIYALERFKDGTINRKYIDYAVNFVDSIWLKEELESIGLKPKTVRFKYGSSDSNLVDKYESMGVVSYIGDQRQEFYGLHKIAELAKLFPTLPFHLYGVKEPEISLPENVTCYGWQPAEVFKKALRENPICLRLTDHDGFSVTVVEAITYGSEVIWSLPFEFSHLARTVEETQAILNELIPLIEQRGMTPNKKNRKALEDYFNRDKVLSNYIKELKEYAK